MILNTIASSSKKRVEEAKKKVSLEELKRRIYDGDKVRRFHNREDFAFEKALKSRDISFICEVKKASPSKGIIAKDFPYIAIAKDYEDAGASAISVLTEPEYFQGSNIYLEEISKEVNIPVLRKDFTVNEYQIYEAKIMGADAVLLICTLLDEEIIERYLKICDELKLSAIVEAHTREEVLLALKSGARIIGVNNRNLATFEVDIHNCIHLRKLVPEDILFIAESGIQTAEDIKELKSDKIDAVLIGETLMRSGNKKEMLRYLRGR
ncbi:indole-3-glycerol phosphate synthase [Mobilisporobacter senegalensis]|uniref:Indole-3-glycerol phosphate synthase n=1 Tax=Mobilisporobacter senegalensis TaxID=1329262 RepID=A0A3N1XZ46_9FIRM|nr:indole-3-glycerol phosphate synthase TrpC [Mobilisporobacter senegalensis]ROR31849.1 indole-3-glycerol phosphate synthase [Mobilisporobacter senegalensis]